MADETWCPTCARKMPHAVKFDRCVWGEKGLPACQDGIRDRRYWCPACPPVADETNAGGLTDAERGSLGWIAACPTDLAAVERIVAEREAAAREQGRAEAEAAWAAAVEALADEVNDWDDADGDGWPVRAHEVRAQVIDHLNDLTADHAKALDAVKVQAAQEARRETLTAIRSAHERGFTLEYAEVWLEDRIYRADRLTTDMP